MSDAKNSAGKKKSAASSSKKDDAPSKPASIILSHRPIMTAPSFSDQTASQGDSAPATAPKLVASREPQLKPLSAPIPEEVTVEKTENNEPEDKAEDNKDSEDAKSKEKEATSAAPVGELKIPVLETEDTDTGDEEKEAKEEKKEDFEPTEEPTEKETADEPEKSEETESESKPVDGAPLPGDEAKEDGKSQPELSNKEKLEQENEQRQAKHDAEIDKMVDSRKYFLPINAVEKRKTKRFILLGIVLSVLLAVAWADIALDAGLIHIGGVKPFTHFFSN